MSMEMKNTAVPGLHGNIFRNAMAGPALAGMDGVQTLYESWQRTVDRFGVNPAIGWRPIDANGVAGDYVWLTYKETEERACDFASGLRNMELCPSTPDFKQGLLGFYAKNRMEWTIGEQACNQMGIVPVPLYDTLGAESVGYVLEQCALTCVLCTSDVAVNMMQASRDLGAQNTLHTLVLMDGSADNVKKCQQQSSDLTGGKVRVLSWSEIEEAGRNKRVAPTPPSSKDPAFFCYTSGTTGNPKGAIITHGNMISNLAALIMGGAADVVSDDGTAVHLSYLPLPHVFERLNNMIIVAYGGRVGFFQGDPLKILDDLVALRPTFFPSVPRLLSRIYDKIMAGVEEAGGMKKTLFMTALNAKLANLRTDKEGEGSLKHRVWDTIVFGPLKKRLGLDRVMCIITGSAPLAPAVMSFLRAVFGCPVLEGYGATESSAAGTLTMPTDYTTGHVGVPSPSNEIALFDVPEMGYMSTDTVHKGDNDMPVRGRGEICLRGVNVFDCYYKMEDKTTETVDPAGWLHTGDIGVWTMDGKLKIVDRKKNIFKLSQGEYVAAEKIENVYGRSPFVMMSFVYGDSLQSCLVAIVVPDPEAIALWASKPENGVPKAGKGMSTEELCANPKVKAVIFADLKSQGKKAKLKGFEQAKAIHLEPEPFDVARGLLTPTFKLKRAPARDHYRGLIDEMYAELTGTPIPSRL